MPSRASSLSNTGLKRSSATAIAASGLSPAVFVDHCLGRVHGERRGRAKIHREPSALSIR